MKLYTFFLPSVLTLFLSSTVYSQNITQVVRGQVIDIESQEPLPYATIAITTTNPQKGTVTDIDGYFRIEDVPVGRHNIAISFVGYENQFIPELMVSTGKETVLTIKMREKISELKEVVIKANAKDKPLNNMATVSARSFSVDEGRRYAGGFDDPGRLASSFAGVTTDNLRDNTIVIRGNSAKGLLWRLEGIEIPNPNHFANLTTFGGGGISAISALVMGNSDFFTGAFPAEYGNAMSGVFDINLRQGNNENFEHAIQLGAMGVDIASEGPLGKNNKASYLFNYRYSTMGLIKYVFPADIKDFLPTYQDFSFKVNMPTKKAGTFSLWGLGADDSQSFKAIQDSADWEMFDNRLTGSMKQQLGAVGANHRYRFNNNSYISTSIAATGDYMLYETDILGFDLNNYNYEYLNVKNYKYTFTSVYNKKFSARHANRTGIIIDNLHNNSLIQYAPIYNAGLIDILDEHNSTFLYRAFSQSKFSLTKNLRFNAGLHANYLALNNEFVVEPRAGLSFNINPANTISIGYGKHSRIEPLTLYYANVNNGTGTSQPNKNMKLAKAHHIVLSYDINLTESMRLKIEPYAQFLYDVPVIPDSNFSTLNMDADFYFTNELINTGTGRNLGIDFTLERFLQDGYYYLFTTSLFDSRYTGDDGIERNSRFNTHYVFNLLFGKEWTYGKQDNKIFGVNLKMNYFGGKRATPVDQFASDLVQDVVLDYNRLYTTKEPNKFHASISLNHRKNKLKHSTIWALQFTNLFMSKENYGLFYNYQTQEVERWEFAVPVPNLSLKIEF